MKLEYLSSGICAGCEVCQQQYGMTETELETALDSGEVCAEGYVSSAGCDLCHDSLQQTLYDGHGIDSNGDIVHIDICADCLMSL